MEATDTFNNAKMNSFEHIKTDFRRNDKNIKTLALTKKEVEKWKTETEGHIATQKDLHEDDLNFREQLESAKFRTEHYFSCIEKSKVIIVSFILTLLTFLIPYYFLQSDSYTSEMFALSIGVVIISFWLGYFYSIRKYKKLIISILHELITNFNNTQLQKEKNAKEYKKRLTHYIPRSIILQSYYKELIEYEKIQNELAQLHLYHRQNLTAFITYIERLLRTLDIENPSQKTTTYDDKIHRSVLNSTLIKNDVTTNDKLYFILNTDNIYKIINNGGKG